MGFLKIFGGKNDENEALKEQEKAKELLKQKEMEELKKAHEELSWPVIQRLNPVNIKDIDKDTMDETVPQERKDEIGPLIYEDDIDQATLDEMAGQELLFLLSAMELYHKKAPLPEFEKNHRKVYNTVLSRIRDAEYLFMLFDETIRYPFIDHGFGNVYFEEETAKQAADLFARQFRKLAVKKCSIEDKNRGTRYGFFDFLYFIGIENLIIDNGGYRARFKRSEIMAAPGEWNPNEKGLNPKNPMLNFAMLDFMEEFRWPVQYEKRNEVLKVKEIRMLSLIRSGQFIVPMQTEGDVKELEAGRIQITPNTKIKLPVMKARDGKEFIPAYTDGFEFGKNPQSKEWRAGIVKYQDILRFIQDKDGVCLNPEGQNIVLTKDRMMAVEAAGQQADMIRKKNQVGKAAANSADSAVQQALNEAMAKMKEENSEQ